MAIAVTKAKIAPASSSVAVLTVSRNIRVTSRIKVGAIPTKRQTKESGRALKSSGAKKNESLRAT